MQVFVNRTLNMKKIKAIGFDMDYTLVRYNTEEFERLTHKETIKKLIEIKKYPNSLAKLNFSFDTVIQGLVIDRRRGNLLKLSRFGKVKKATHGTKAMPFRQQQRIYGNMQIDLNHPHFQVLDTNFAVSNGVLFAQLVDAKEKGLDLPDYETISYDIKGMLDLAHSDGTLKNQVKQDIAKYIVQDPDTAKLMERFKKYDKKLWIITNSDFAYCKLLLDYTITPFLKEHKSWQEIFDITITLSSKPGFFQNGHSFLKIDPESGLMSNFFGKLENGIYQGGNAIKLQNDFELDGEDILYLGDHIYGDVLALKKTCNWRTALVIDPIKDELEGLNKGQSIQEEIDQHMKEKEKLEQELNRVDLEQIEKGINSAQEEVDGFFKELEKVNASISRLIERYNSYFNNNWGELMRAGQEASRFADQVEKYACIYMEKVPDLLKYSPKTYFRPHRKILAHEV